MNPPATTSGQNKRPLALSFRLSLFIHRREGSLERFEPNGTTVVLGSDPACDVVLSGGKVAPRHAVIEFAEGVLTVTDHSAQGTDVGGRKVRNARSVFEPKDVLRIADHHLRVQITAGAARPHLSAPTQVMKAVELIDRSDFAVDIDDDDTDAGDTAAAEGAPHSLAQGILPALQAAPAVNQPSPVPVPVAIPAKAPKREVSVSVRRRIHRDLIDNLDLARLERSRMNDHLLRAKVAHALGQIVERYRSEMPSDVDTARLVEELAYEAIGLGPLEPLLADDKVAEIMVVDPQTIYIERERKVFLTDSHFTDEESTRAVLERIVAPLGRRIDESSPLLDARLADGSRVNAVVRPLALRGTCITIRKFPAAPLAMDDLITFGTITPRMARFLQRAVTVRKNLLISGGTGSGKTTLLNILSGAIPEHERIVTIEDAAELRLRQPHVVSLESRPSNMEGKGEISIRDLVRNAMRMRPDRIIVGECRGGEALDMLQAMNTGHSGSMTTTHANNPPEAVKRIETLSLMSGLDMPSRALREQIAAAIEVIVQQTRLSDGTRKITSIAEVIGLDDDGQIETREIFGYRQLGTGPTGQVNGEFYATGNLPTFVGDFVTRGLVKGEEEVV
ncbi:MAG: pilus assembly protein CpaF [Myxococcales bacterium]|jgi:pilus assembly protein CpaF|nr:pilus assembly protein CpaF [Myxococcales bacterium]